MLKRVFKVTEDGKELDLAVVRPDSKKEQQAQLVYNKAFRSAIDSGAIVNARVDKILREQGLWDEAKETEINDLTRKLLDGERKLKAGGMKLSEGRKLAIDMKIWRGRRNLLLSERGILDDKTAEGQAENAKFNYLLSVCTVYNPSGTSYFKNYEDYEEKLATTPARMAMSNFMQLLYNYDEEMMGKLPENKFLKEWKFVNDKLQLVNKDGDLVDTDGRRIDSEGYYLNDEGKRVDPQGNLLGENGEYLVETKPFLDDDGNEIAG